MSHGCSEPSLLAQDVPCVRASVHGSRHPEGFVERLEPNWSATSMPTPDSMSKARALLHRHWPVSTWDKFEACVKGVAQALDEARPAVKPYPRTQIPVRWRNRLHVSAFKGTGVQ